MREWYRGRTQTITERIKHGRKNYEKIIDDKLTRILRSGWICFVRKKPKTTCTSSRSAKCYNIRTTHVETEHGVRDIFHENYDNTCRTKRSR